MDGRGTSLHRSGQPGDKRRLQGPVVSRRALLVLAIGILLTLFLSGRVYRVETEKHNAQFTREAELRVRLFDESIDDAVTGLRSLNQLFAISDTPVSRAQFRAMAMPLLKEHPYLRSFVFHRYVRPGERRAYEAAMRTRHPGFTIKQEREGRLVPATGPGPWLVIEFFEPLPRNDLLLGYDGLSDPVHALAAQRAIDSGMVAASGLKPFVQSRQRGVEGKVFTLMAPLYRPGAPLDDVAARRRAFIGENVAGVHAHRFARQIFERAGLLATAGIHINVYAAPSPTEAALLFRHGAPPPPVPGASPLLERLLGPAALTRVSHTVDIGGTPLHLVVSRAPPAAGSAHASALLVLAAGIALSLLGAAYLDAVAARSRIIERTVEERTAQLHARTCELQRTAAELQLRNRAIEASANAMFITGAQGPDYIVEYVNPAFERTTGYPSAEMVGKPTKLLVGADVEQPGLIELRAALAACREGHATVRCYRKDGAMYWNEVYLAPVRDENGEVHHFVHVNYDVTETKRYQEQLEYRANFDPLTGLANRNLLQDRLQQAISYASRTRRTVWVAFLDLDRFKFVNDSAGHSCGDMLLKVVAERLQASVRAADTVGRMGGDEFVLVLPQYETGPMTAATIEKVMAQVARPIPAGGKEFFVSCSIGIAVFPDDGSDSETLLMHADVAMYRAKEMGRNNYQFFEPALNTRTQARLRIESALRNALARDEFVLHYQPQVDLKTGRMIGVEALIRWQHPEFGMVSPAEFITLAEETGLIVPIGAWVLRSACAQGRAWQAAGYPLRMAVNLSGIQFAQHDLVQTVVAALDDSGFDPACLEIELTESIVMHDVEKSIATLHQLKLLGVQLAVDDFGTGYSSLAYLKLFPIDVLKIDQSFVRDIATSADDAMIVLSMISLAHNLGLKVIAEGVETPEQLAYLRRHDCDEIQGNHFSRPIAAAAIGQMLHTERCL
ncbi:bifunctional diguanylate cyclase/phosphodiesterase [Massilia niastensis]|uniref:bifunctional diguanylate cyclase/phosphodiesterase n=1 Tax=Massilia niastensis TaxID=544911 RepID=UPI0009FE3E52|nr:EAL domain-containing protein [Massilia niastensis]